MTTAVETSGMRGTAVHGAFWNIAMAVGNKAVTTVGQIALTWYLLPKDMGVVAMAASVIAWATFFTASGIDDLLVQRYDTYERDAPQIFWMSLCFNVLALGVVVALMPFAVRHFGDGRIGRLMLIQAASWPISTLTLVLRPKLANLLRFKAIAVTQLGQGVIFTVTAVLFAAWGWGPYALVWPILLGVCFTGAVFWGLSGKLPLEWPRPSSWPAYLRPGLLLMIGNFVAVMTVQVPNFIVGSVFDAGRTGLYAEGYLVASQAIFLLVLNLRGLFTPLFSKMKTDPVRMAEATTKSVHAVTVAVAPICVLQAFFARPLIETFFAPRWAGTAAVVFWLSLGFGAQPVALITQSVLVAAGRFGLALGLAFLQAFLIALGVAWGCAQGGIQSAAIGAAVAGLLCLPLNLWVLHARVACPWARLAAVPSAVLLSIAAFLPSYGVFRLVGGCFHWWSNATEFLLYGLSLFLLYRLFDPAIFTNFVGVKNGTTDGSMKLPRLPGGGR